MAVAPAEATPKYHPGQRGRPLKTRLRLYARAMSDMLLVLLWLPATLTGLMLWEPLGMVPAGPGKGEKVLLWGLTTGQWGDIHWWVSAAAVAVTLLHVALDFKAFKGAVKYLIRARGVPS